jgi:hypothetical protein
MTSNKASNLAILITYENGRPTGSGDTIELARYDKSLEFRAQRY